MVSKFVVELRRGQSSIAASSNDSGLVLILLSSLSFARSSELWPAARQIKIEVGKRVFISSLVLGLPISGERFEFLDFFLVGEI